MRETSDLPSHTVHVEQLFERLESSTEGLSGEQAEARFKENGPNTLEAEEGVSWMRMLIRQVHNPLIYLLLAAAVVSLVVGHGVDSAVIVGVVILNTLLGFFQEWRAEGALAALRQMAAPSARVHRDGQSVEIEATEVVPGDVLVLETGDRVAADARMLSSEHLQVDESALTGESKPVSKEPDDLDVDMPMADMTNMVWMSTSVTGGRGRAVVIATGMETQMGHIAGQVRQTRREKTPLQKRMHKLGILLGGTGIALATAVFFLGLARGYELVEMLLFSVAFAVSAIPEGLPAVISVTLALGVRRMADRHAIIRRLPAVETLGSTTVICSDKTGTITKNQMTVRKVWAGGSVFNVTGEGYHPEGQIKGEDENKLDALPETLERLLYVGAVANNAHVKQQDGNWRASGNPSEAALLVVAGKGGLDPDALREKIERVDEVPFSSDRKYMATLHPQQEGEGRVALVKGAPDRLLDFCDHVLIDGERKPLDDELRERINGINEDFAGHALRVMAGAYRDFPADKQEIEPDDVESGLTLTGLWGMIDPPREESAAAVEEARQAGIRAVMITGDHAVTAAAIARQVGIAGQGEALSGRDVERLEKKELAEAALRDGVFARVTPAHKLKIMEALKGHGEIVAMTGDGVNDAPALKGADIGVAMGQAGTEVAKEAADMVLTDDNFATIVHAVEEGRVIYNNLRGVIFFLLSCNAGEVIVLGGALIWALDLPMTATMILWVNLVTAGACTIPLGIEPAHEDVLRERPRDPKEPIINTIMLRRLAFLTPLMGLGTLLLFWYKLEATGIEEARTIAFTTMVGFEWFQALNARSQRLSIFSIGFFSNRWLLLGVGIAILLQLMVVHTPVGHFLLNTAPLSAFDWLLVVLVSSSVWIVDEILKRFGVHGSPRLTEE